MRNRIFFLLLSILIISCSKPEPRKPIVRKTSSFMSESVKRNKVLNSFEEKLFKIKMERDSLNKYISSEFGFWYSYNKKDSLSNQFPVKGDEVVFSYEIRNFQDNIIYSKEELGDKNYLVDQEDLITGLQEGIKLMKEGEIITFLFPSYKAFGYSGNDKIESNEPLIYEVHLKIINNKN
ncbi:MAG: gliding motility-associated peptidyl-prolyl isomerase GldI [Flavobacteriaceae bacterium]|nr:gliding motility-associated peptidyl-prolyl isomerase GldI [Flavobacteriaceae bacterium]